MNDGQPPNGNVFSIGTLLNLIVPFEFPCEGQTVTGRWYKYKTSTRAYVQAKTDERLAQLDQWAILQQEIQTLQPNDPRVEELTSRAAKLQESATRANTSWLVDALVEWNVAGLDGEIIPITPEGFAGVPIPFLVMLAEFLVESRTDKNPTLTDSQSS